MDKARKHLTGRGVNIRAAIVEGGASGVLDAFSFPDLSVLGEPEPRDVLVPLLRDGDRIVAAEDLTTGEPLTVGVLTRPASLSLFAELEGDGGTSEPYVIVHNGKSLRFIERRLDGPQVAVAIEAAAIGETFPGNAPVRVTVEPIPVTAVLELGNPISYRSTILLRCVVDENGDIAVTGSQVLPYINNHSEATRLVVADAPGGGSELLTATFYFDGALTEPPPQLLGSEESGEAPYIDGDLTPPFSRVSPARVRLPIGPRRASAPFGAFWVSGLPPGGGNNIGEIGGTWYAKAPGAGGNNITVTCSSAGGSNAPLLVYRTVVDGHPHFVVRLGRTTSQHSTNVTQLRRALEASHPTVLGVGYEYDGSQPVPQSVWDELGITGPVGAIADLAEFVLDNFYSPGAGLVFYGTPLTYSFSGGRDEGRLRFLEDTTGSQVRVAWIGQA